MIREKAKELIEPWLKYGYWRLDNTDVVLQDPDSHIIGTGTFYLHDPVTQEVLEDYENWNQDLLIPDFYKKILLNEFNGLFFDSMALYGVHKSWKKTFGCGRDAPLPLNDFNTKSIPRWKTEAHFIFGADSCEKRRKLLLYCFNRDDGKFYLKESNLEGSEFGVFSNIEDLILARFSVAKSEFLDKYPSMTP